jgi:uncharacterized protein (TIGR00266 family)
MQTEILYRPSFSMARAKLDSGEEIRVERGAMVSMSDGVAIETNWGGAKGFFGSGGLILLNASGSGSLILSSYSAIHEMTLAANQKFTIDTGHIVAFTEGISFKVRHVGGLKSTLLSGEGLVVELTGPGPVLMQTRSIDALLSWLIHLLPKSKD